LASRLALEIPKDYDLHEALDKKAAEQINIAITQNLNMGNHKYGRGSTYGESWDYIPKGPAA
jgi:hypothetical protein